MKYLYFGIYILLCVAVTLSNPVVNTKYGQVEGISVPIHTGQIIDVFMAIPYAKPPVGNLRFASPEEPDPWSDVFLATEPGNACIQPLLNSVESTHFGWENYDEDCLNLNIYALQTNSTDLQPVLVFIHGGDFRGGAGFSYPGYFNAAYGVVLVTINYRLGILGFATTEDEVLPGNLGLLDQTLALHFIQENIEAFGGDPDRVTISGESAGAVSVGLHLVSQLSHGLFHAAILQSGSELAYWGLQSPEEQPSNYVKQVAEQVNCTTVNSQEMVDCLRTKNAQRLILTPYECTEGYHCGTFRPTIDGYFLTDYPWSLRQRGEFREIPEIIGVNKDDSSIFLPVFLPVADLPEGVNRTDFDDAIYDALAEVAPSWPDPSRLDDAVQAARFYYADWPYFYDLEKNRDMATKLLTDLQFGYSGDIQAKHHSKGSSVYFYVYDYVLENGNFPDYYGTYHGAEIQFIHGWPFFDDPRNAFAYNHSLVNPLTEVVYTDNDRAMADFMMTLWSNFAKFGNPTPEAEGLVNGSTILWPLYSQNNLTYAHLARDPVVAMDYRQQEYAFWAYYLPYITQGEQLITPADL